MPATSAEKRAAVLQNSSTASGRLWRRLWSSRRDPQAIHHTPSFGGVKRGHRIHHVGQGLDVQTADAEHHHRPELLVVNHAEQHLHALGARSLEPRARAGRCVRARSL